MMNIPSPLPKTSDAWLEHDIKVAGADKAPRITPADIEANIVSEWCFTARDGAIVDYWGKAPDVTGLTLLASDALLDEYARNEPAADGPLSLLTFCVLVLRNGFTVTGESACASPENFDAEIGRKIARENAVNQIWPLMGYELKSKLAGENK